MYSCEVCLRQRALSKWWTLYSCCRQNVNENPAQRLEYHTIANKKILIHSLVLQMIEWHCFSTGLTWLIVPFPTPAGLQKISSIKPWKYKQKMGGISLLLNNVRDWEAACAFQKGDNQPSWSHYEQVSVGSNPQNAVCRTIGDKEMVPSDSGCSPAISPSLNT